MFAFAFFLPCAVWPTPRVDPKCKAVSNGSYTSRWNLFFWQSESEIRIPAGQRVWEYQRWKRETKDPLILLINQYHRNSWAMHAWQSQMRVTKTLAAEQRFAPSVQASFEPFEIWTTSQRRWDTTYNLDLRGLPACWWKSSSFSRWL